jgi:uncharacterized membrane protein YidH (DUF202 family)
MGNTKWVHRACLDDWRARGATRNAFTHCEICRFEFAIDQLSNDTEEAQASRMRRYKMHVARDTIAVLLAIQLCIVAIAWIVKLADTSDTLRDAFPDWISDHEKTTYYICGVVLFLAILGMVGTVTWCCGCFDEGGDLSVQSPPSIRRDGTRSYVAAPNCYGCYCMDCPRNERSSSGSGACGGCDGGACAGAGEAFIIVIIIIIIIAAIVGVFVLFFACTFVIQRILQRNMRILWLKQEVVRYVVHDYGHGSPPPVASAPPEEDIELGMQDDQYTTLHAGEMTGSKTTRYAAHYYRGFTHPPEL